MKHLPLSLQVYSVLCIKVMIDLFHPAFLSDSKWTAGFTMSAVQAGICLDIELGIVVSGNDVPGLCKIVILIYQTDINACRAGLAVVAIDAGAGNGVSSKGTDNGVIFFFVGSSQEFQHLIQVFHSLHTGHSHQYAGAVDGVLQALIMGQSNTEGGLIGAQTKTKDAEFFLRSSVGELSVFHKNVPP